MAADTKLINPLDTLLAASAATMDFKEAVGRLAKGSAPGPLMKFSGNVPPVKALRTITKLLEMEPALAIREVAISAQSGCSDFTGTLTINGGEHVVDFKWDCAWRAQQEGWTDAFGYPDQIRAAQTFGYQCFEEWNPRKVA